MYSYFLVFLLALATVECGPLHASCKLDWTFKMQCSAVKDGLIKAINSMSGFSMCGTGEKCGYKVVSQTDSVLKATHTTREKHYIDDMDFTFAQVGDTCKVHGHSTAETWYAILDYGTNYCNMRNLLEGANLHTSAGFTETTSNSVCTQYTSHNCNVH